MNEKDKKDRPLSDIVRWQQNLPVVHIPQHQLAKPLGRMEYVALISRLAMDMGSDAIVYSVLKLITTTRQAELLKQTYEDMPPEVEASYRKLTEKYIALMEAIPEKVSAKLLAELERIPADPSIDGLLSKLRDWLGE